MMSNWWADKLGNTPTYSTPDTPTYSTPNTPTHNAPTAERPDTNNPNIENAKRKAQSSREVETCPNCYSGNYMSSLGSRKRCYDCNYPLLQSGSGAISTGSSSPAIPAKQRGQSDGYNPNIIVGKV